MTQNLSYPLQYGYTFRSLHKWSILLRPFSAHTLLAQFRFVHFWPNKSSSLTPGPYTLFLLLFSFIYLIYFILFHFYIYFYFYLLSSSFLFIYFEASICIWRNDVWKKEKKQRCGFDRDFQKEKLEFKREVKFLRAIIKFFESNNQIFLGKR